LYRDGKSAGELQTGSCGNRELRAGPISEKAATPIALRKAMIVPYDRIRSTVLAYPVVRGL